MQQPGDMDSRLLIIKVNDIDDTLPKFEMVWRWDSIFGTNQFKGGIQTFALEPTVPGDLPLGQVTASDEDLPPNNEIFYYLLPTCTKVSFSRIFFLTSRSEE